jgi:chemotaxis protein methyltransferase CheR
MKCDFDLSEVEFRLLRDFIHDTCGIYFADEKRSFIRNKLYPRVITFGFNSFTEYIRHLKYSSEGPVELNKMLSVLTNTETYFFREWPQLQVFHEHVLPEVRNRKLAENDKKIRILSAGCSTGEEVYTIAMLAFENGGFFWGWDFKVTGLDINSKALERAALGKFPERAFRMSDEKYKRKFFNPNSHDYLAKESLKKMTSFVAGNITDSKDWNGMEKVDVLFCRNVLIYFSDEKISQAMENFHRILRRGGHLLLGHSETMTNILDKFEPVRFPETVIYRKR